VEQLVESGKYQNASEVLREGLRLVERRESEDRLRLSMLRKAIARGLDDIEAGNFTSFDTEEALASHLDQLADESITGK
jgi:antitoxin ParD1/3/4